MTAVRSRQEELQDMAEESFNEATLKRLQLISGLIDVLVDLIAQGARVDSVLVMEILNKLIKIIQDAQYQIEEDKL